MHRIKAFFKNILVKTLIFIGVLTAIILWITDCSLKKSTCLGCEITVPDFTGLMESDVQKVCTERGLKYQIKDTAYVKKLPKRCMVDQIPPFESKVKEGRTIYLTINSDKPPMAKLKDLSGSVERQAIKILENAGFVVNPDSKYEPDPAEGWVLKVEADGEEVEWGSRLPKGTVVTLVLGDGSKTGEPLRAPDYRGVEFKNIRRVMSMHHRVMGKVDSTLLIGPSSQAVIYKQDPAPHEKIKPSDPINIWIIDESTFNTDYAPFLETEHPDSTDTEG
ncbi:PASTA domain-containing protein [bacterium]|nr:PASTA domain-containing protein [bacterium]